MVNTRFGKDTIFKGAIVVNNAPVDLEDLDLKAVATPSENPRDEIELALNVTGNKFAITFAGTAQPSSGVYVVTLWQNKGKAGQTAIDVKAVRLIEYTFKETGARAAAELDVYTIELGTIEMTDEAIEQALQAAQNANEAARSANNAAERASIETSEAREAAQGANEAAQNANSAAQRASTEAANAAEQALKAKNDAYSAHMASLDAQNAAINANNASYGAEKVNAQLDGNTLIVTNRTGTANELKLPTADDVDDLKKHVMDSYFVAKYGAGSLTNDNDRYTYQFQYDEQIGNNVHFFATEDAKGHVYIRVNNRTNGKVEYIKLDQFYIPKHTPGFAYGNPALVNKNLDDNGKDYAVIIDNNTTDLVYGGYGYIPNKNTDTSKLQAIIIARNSPYTSLFLAFPKYELAEVLLERMNNS